MLLTLTNVLPKPVLYVVPAERTIEITALQLLKIKNDEKPFGFGNWNLEELFSFIPFRSSNPIIQSNLCLPSTHASKMPLCLLQTICKWDRLFA